MAQEAQKGMALDRPPARLAEIVAAFNLGVGAVRYLYRCPQCRQNLERDVPMACRDMQFCATCRTKLRRRLGDELKTKIITVPQNLHTSMSDVIGAPGTSHRARFERQQKAGKIQYAGPGSRWV